MFKNRMPQSDLVLCPFFVVLCAVLIGCTSISQTARHPATTAKSQIGLPGPEPSPNTTATAGFALYFQEETVLLPLTPGAQPIHASGIWMPKDDNPEVVLHYIQQAAPHVTGLPVCACNDQQGACINQGILRAIDARTENPVADATGCSCHGWTSPQGSVGVAEYPLHRSNEFYGGQFRPCEIPEFSARPESVVGGVVYLVGSGSSLADPCGNSSGCNLYSMWGDHVPMAKEAPQNPFEEVEWQHCELGIDFPEFFDIGTEATQNDDDDLPGDDDPEYEALCHSEDVDVRFPWVQSGYYCTVGKKMAVVGMESTRVYCQPLPAQCPSSMDPCGTGHNFTSLNKEKSRWWASSNEQSAVSLNKSAGRVYWLQDSRRVSSWSFRLDTEASPIGVLYFSNISPLQRAMQHDYLPLDLSTPATQFSCTKDQDCKGPMVCDPRRNRCIARCRLDQDCASLGFCGATCLSDGHCTDKTQGECSRYSPCNPGFFCVDGTCDSCRSSEDCQIDQNEICDEGICQPAPS